MFDKYSLVELILNGKIEFNRENCESILDMVYEYHGNSDRMMSDIMGISQKEYAEFGIGDHVFYDMISKAVEKRRKVKLASSNEKVGTMQESNGIGIPELQKAVKYARNTGYLLHDLRNPEFYTVDNSLEIKKIDSAFMDAANGLGMDFVSFAGYGESAMALELVDQFADKILDVGNAENVTMKNMDVYSFVLPLFKSSMKKWLDSISVNDMGKLKEYWANV